MIIRTNIGGIASSLNKKFSEIDDDYLIDNKLVEEGGESEKQLYEKEISLIFLYIILMEKYKKTQELTLLRNEMVAFLSKKRIFAKTKFKSILKRIIKELDFGNVLYDTLKNSGRVKFEFAQSLIKELKIINRIAHISFNYDLDSNSSNKDSKLFQFSTGETLYFSMISRVLEKLEEEIHRTDKDLPIVILLDEVDLSLHPQRQKELLDTMIMQLNSLLEIYDKKKRSKVYLLLTTHSPFLASDMIKGDIIYLERDTKLVSGSFKYRSRDFAFNSSSFGANIHSILANSFYIKDSLVGNFSRRKISTWLKELEQGNIVDVPSMEKAINCIGEDYIRDALLYELKKA